ncbi:SWIM zinc finger domain-containing protein [Nocardioides sp. SLBN-35]|uniref:SWIM zinc finger family protein n=1 Tax=Nocardioides sp. SLBN-35 TaxID=2768445 RepID=UPI00114FCB0D|nr:SWIM zinc finger family protein [Nocardioides sp. SLBN-35]TQK69286.1 SWIM zinc finger protein [Nocardioides sp. SLBN-35]
MPRWNFQAVEKAAPDASSLTAARKLAVPGPWSETGSTDTLVWGRCQGSGRTPYQVSIDLAGPAYRCSCPSRKFPCKHALALLLLWVRSDGAVADAAEPAGFAGDWAATRAERAAGAAAAEARRPVDPEARARRIAERRATMSAALEDFAQWLADLARSGTATTRRQPWTWWDTTAARLVDGQVPGLAERLRDMAAAVGSREDWAEHLLTEAGRWWLAVQAWRRWDDLAPETQGDLRTYLGWSWGADDLADAEPAAGWQVLGAHRDETGRLKEQRTWLRSVATGELVLVLDFAGGPQPLPVPQLDGSVVDVPLVRYPGSAPARARFAAPPAPLSLGTPLPSGGSLADARAALSDLWRRNPWAVRVPAVVRGRLVPPYDGAPATFVDESGDTVDVLGPDPWDALAATGGAVTDVFGELEERGLRPLSLVGVDR